jgi:zinc D-Ala-D-Ala carboxypeptidase
MQNDLHFFKPVEFACRCGCGAGFEQMDGDFLLLLDRARMQAGCSFPLSSAFRCAKHNAKVGGVTDSAHTLGKAVDIAIHDGVSRLKVVRALILAGFLRIGIGSGLVHVDCDSSKPDSIWLYANK